MRLFFDIFIGLIPRPFWFPYFFTIFLFLSASRICYWLHFEKGFLRLLSRRLLIKSIYLSILWVEDFIKFYFTEEDIMARIHGIRPDQIHDYILKDQEKDSQEDQIIWKVKYLSVSDSAKITDMIYSARGFGKKREEVLKAGTQQLQILRLGLVGWENFKYDDGKEVEWEPVPTGGNLQQIARIMDRNLDKVPPEVRDELADHIRGSSTLELD